MRLAATTFAFGAALGAAGALWTARQFGGGTVFIDQPRADGRPTAQAFFSPKGGCTDAIVEAIGGAASEVLMQAYSFTSDPIRDALIAAHRRGVTVRVILDREASEEPHSERRTLAKAGLELWTDGEHPIAHNKILVVDRRTVVTGSFNFTKQAETGNAENVLVLHHPDLAARYAEQWEGHRAHSQRARR
jgi:phosphatidylserine/phosphatidylglycerophosphate/cardiolipin synthase-like enzyme